MSTPFMAEIKIFSFNFAPKGWALANGQFLPINQNQALFSLMGTYYGGNGQTTFALPNLRGRVPIHMGAGHNIGEAAGASSVTINLSSMPAHNHFVMASDALPDATAANATPGPTGTKFLARANAALQGGQTAPVSLYGGVANLTTLAPNTVTNVGGSQAHQNLMPLLVLNFGVALQGIFPSQN